MWPPSSSAKRILVPSGKILGVDWSTPELRCLGEAVQAPATQVALHQMASMGISAEHADELAAAYRLGGTAALAQVLEAVRVKL